MITWLIFCIISCRLTVSIYKQRKFYQTMGVEVFGTVLLWNRKKADYDKMYPVHYELEVEADGQQYSIETSNPKARKYKKKTDITLVIVNPSGSVPESGRQFRNMHNPTANLYGIFLSEIDQANNTDTVIIKEDIKSISELLAGIALTLIFALCTVIRSIEFISAFH